MAGNDDPSLQSLRSSTTGVQPADGESATTDDSRQDPEETTTHGSPDSPADPSIGEILASTLKTWGPLEIRRTIGKGRFGTVCVAWDPGLEREVALKILHE